jgi:DnaJ-class molecular chaperone
MDIRIEDLLDKCKRCNGTGDIDERYKPSGGIGQHLVSQTGTCPDCDGSGGTLTKSGEAIAEVVKFVKRRHG